MDQIYPAHKCLNATNVSILTFNIEHLRNFKIFQRFSFYEELKSQAQFS